MPHGAVAALVEDVAEVYTDIPAVLGPPAQARAFAEAWALCQGRTVKPGMRQRIYELRKVVQPAALPAGELRLAGRRDLDVVTGWLEQFGHETGVAAPNIATFVAGHINNKTLFVWEAAGEPRTAALYAGKTPHGVRIGFVYTPPQFRRRGYATACTAMVSQRALDSGNAFCCLYTDLSNPTSNDIYQRIGYTPVCDVADYVLE
jgi:predicted GNAT family acetyltransferase